MLERGKCTQLEAVRWHLKDGEWWTLEGLTAACRNFVGASEAGVSARIRDLRQEGLTIEREPVRKGAKQCKYRMTELGGGSVSCKLRQPRREETVGRAMSRPAADFSSTQGNLFGGGGFARNPQEPAPSFSREYPD